MFLTIIAFIFVLGILVLVHELGHFLAAKAFGVKVEEFAFGFPPRIFSWKRGETNYSLNAIPIGGYVKMLGELEHSKDKRAFENQAPWKRLIISLAGVTMNFLLAWLALWICFSVGTYPVATDPNSLPGQKIYDSPIVVAVADAGIAKSADIKAGDELVSGSAAGATTVFQTGDDIGSFTRAHAGQEVSLIIDRGKDSLEKTVTLSNDSAAPLGISSTDNIKVKIPWYQAFYVSLRESVVTVKLMFELFGDMIKGIFMHEGVSGVGGPIKIFSMTGVAAQAGIISLTRFIAVLSLNLMILNILPFPALDGGRSVFIIVEAIFRKRLVHEKIENIVHLIGFAILIVLMFLISYQDILDRIRK
ncbi:MAG: site-2 protease family protein [Candidatus Berkelbacteria bacterium]